MQLNSLIADDLTYYFHPASMINSRQKGLTGSQSSVWLTIMCSLSLRQDVIDVIADRWTHPGDYDLPVLWRMLFHPSPSVCWWDGAQKLFWRHVLAITLPGHFELACPWICPPFLTALFGVICSKKLLKLERGHAFFQWWFWKTASAPSPWTHFNLLTQMTTKVCVIEFSTISFPLITVNQNSSTFS